ncbi:N-acetyl-1-D-myo-inositol-2-amino-2-deoxy-alpha-D-glucopyranoside deacetylase [Saccharopolyspora griseoalba]|uniref:1D-myo-inositol 2-acetamido-2-deoxy-alpha-D-glucopyranoside deacetylase n=1 Tax=Saccharopolyspora griseoalba TaxID=1431848 RepID=A0ABW2LL90_9PSEU
MPAARLLLVHAHPDDETLWTGGTIARYAARGVEVVVVTCTLGEAGEVIPAELRGLVADEADQLGGYRIGELRGALSALRVSEHRFLGGAGRWRDSGMLWDEPGKATAVPDAHPRAFAIGDPRTQADQLLEIIEELAPQVVVTYAEDGGYGHPDHVRAHEITADAVGRSACVRRLFHAVPSREALDAGLAELAKAEDLPFRLPEPHELPGVAAESITTEIDVTEHLPAKVAALRAHATQVEVFVEQRRDGSGVASFALSNGIAQPLLGAEHYVLAAGAAEGCENDLFGGLETA